MARAVCGIQSQNLRESTYSLSARIEDFGSEELTTELRPGGGLVRTWAVRFTMHTIPSKDLHLFLLGGASKRGLQWQETMAKRVGYPPRDLRMKLFYSRFLEEVAGRTFSADELRIFVNGVARRRNLREGVWSGLGEMAFLGLVVHAGRKGSRNLWVRTSDWIPQVQGPQDALECRLELLRRYISCHGPVSVDDITYWAYLTKRQTKEGLDGLGDEVAEAGEGRSPTPLYDLRAHIEEDYPPAPEVVLLPMCDSLMLCMRDQSRFMKMADYKRVFPRLPVGMVLPTVLLDGFAVATWQRFRRGDRVSVEVRPFHRLEANQRKTIEMALEEHPSINGSRFEVKWSKIA